MLALSSDFQTLNDKEYFEVDGGIPAPVVGALIAAAITIIGGLVSMDMQNAAEQGKNDAYNDIKDRQNGSGNGVILL